MAPAIGAKRERPSDWAYINVNNCCCKQQRTGDVEAAARREGNVLGGAWHASLFATIDKANTMALELRPNCECCDRDLPPASTAARICSYECTFCADCVDNVLDNVCPNCGGGFAPRPIRPATEWRPGLTVAKRPPSDKRRSLSYSREEIAALSQRIRGIPPEKR